MRFTSTLIILSFCVLFACNEKTGSGENKATPPPAQQSPYENLRSQAIPEEDIMSRIELGLNTLQVEYDNSVASMPDLGKVTVEVDESCNLNIKNEKDGVVYETKVNMKDLNTEQGGMRLIPDDEPGEFPGLRVKVINDEAKVSVLKDGVEMTKNNELVIYLATRKSIEKVTPAILQTLRICKEEI